MPENLEQKQTERRAQLYALLGDLPARDRPISGEVVALEERETHVLQTLMLDLNGIEPVPAYFSLPRGGSRPLPVVLYNHAHGGGHDIGKEEFVRGRPAIVNPPYAETLARRGIAGFCTDTWNFGERRGRTEFELYTEMLWKGQILWGMMIYDSIRAIDYLATRPELDMSRLGTMGLSMGSTMSWWLAALDTRVKVCIDLCCLTDFHTLIETRHLDGHGLYYFVPSLLKHFTTADINALIAPRPHLSLAGNYDRLTPPAGLERIDRELREVYGALGVPERWRLRRWDIGHYETRAMRHEILQFLETYL
ncbi:MAG: acetylxylan esterase [Armatimonadetes bacterium]|nr:acetylxylan esterase [Armatimonadota bacterium]